MQIIARPIRKQWPDLDSVVSVLAELARLVVVGEHSEKTTRTEGQRRSA